jgi:hypothetical protein
MFNIPIPSENKIIRVEDSIYLSLYNQLRDNREVLHFLQTYEVPGVVIEDYIFEHKPLDYQIL